MKSRIPFLFAIFLFAWCFVLLRAGQLQFLPADKLQSRQERQFQSVVRLEARRAALLDRKGRELALSVKAYSLFADPSKLDGPKWVAKKIAKPLQMNPDQLFVKLKDRRRQFVWLARKIDPEIQEQIQAMGIPGLGFVEEYKRVYPNDELLAPAIGMVGSEGQGLEGLELSLDKFLRGESRKVTVPRDARGRPLIMDGLMFAEVPEGQDAQLTIDSEIQNELEKELSRTVREFGADQAYGVILDVATSELVAIAMAPTFDANAAGKTSVEKRRHRTVTDVFEPGSVLKTFAIAAALEENLIQPSTRINTEHGRFKVNDRWIREAEASHNWASLTVPEILSFSSNVGTAKIAMMLGDKKLREYYERFGFGTKTGIEFPGEQRGALLPLPWHDHLLSNVSFGQGVSTTPLQVAAAYLAIANGGVWKKPRILKALKDPSTGEMKEIPVLPEESRRVMSPEKALAVRLMLTGVTADGGTGKNARVDGFMVAGKTGTAQKVNPRGGGYMEGAYVSSFAGFLPAENPKYVIYISVDHPKKISFYGSQVSAPVFSRMAGYITRQEGWAPVLVEERNLTTNDWKALKAKSPKVSCMGKPGISCSKLSKKDLEWLRARERARSKSLAAAVASPVVASVVQDLPVVPQMTNYTVREVLKKVEGQEVELRIVGSGVVHETWPRAGGAWAKKKQLTLFLRPQLKQGYSLPSWTPGVSPLSPSPAAGEVPAVLGSNEESGVDSGEARPVHSF